MITVEELLSITVMDGDCLLCYLTPSQVYANIKGYGKAHRYVWERLKGPIPKGMFVCHSCDTPRCINIGHLFLGTPQDNMNDKVKKGRQTFGGPGKKLKPHQLPEIMVLRELGLSYREIGNEYNVSRRTIERFIND